MRWVVEDARPKPHQGAQPGIVSTEPSAERPSPASWPGVALWALCVLLVLVVRLGAAPLFDVDEGAFAEATREMVTSGDGGFPTLDGAPRFDKPILIYWVQAAALRIFGVHEWALRLPSALSVWLWCLVVAGFAAKRWSRRTGIVAGTVLATSVGPLIIGRACTADGLLNLLLALALLDGWRSLETRNRVLALRAYLWIALGLLTKGPIALVIPAAVSGVFLLWRRQPKAWLRLAFDPWGWLILLAVAGPWYGYALQRHGMDFVDGFLVRHNVARYTTTLEHHGGSLAYYVLIVPVLLLPWASLLPQAARSLWNGRRAPLEGYLLVWACFVVAFFSLSGTKLPHYALYGSTPLVLALALVLERSSARERASVAGLVAFLLVILIAGPWLVPEIAPLIQDPLYAALLREPACAWPLQVGAGCALVALIGAWAWRGPSTHVVIGAAVALALVLGTLAVPWLGDTLQGPVKEAARMARERGAPAVQWQVRLPSFSFYRGAPTPRAEPTAGQLAITKETRLNTLGPPVQVLFRARGYALVLVEGGEQAEIMKDRTSSAAR